MYILEKKKINLSERYIILNEQGKTVKKEKEK